jgi:hypothetical protein
MKRTITTISLAIFVISLIAIGVSFKGRAGVGSVIPSVQAQDHDSGRGRCPRHCSTETLEGCYATNISGFIVSNAPAFQIGPAADVGVLTFDGDGNVTRVGTTSFNGTIVPPGLTLTGTYVVNPDCTGSYTLQIPNVGPATSNFVINNEGRELQIIVAATGRVLSGVARKQ